MTLPQRGNSGLVDCPYCRGEGEIRFNPSWSVPKDPQLEDSARCPTCRGDGTIAARTWRLVVCVFCLEHVNDCRCDPEDWRGDKLPTLTLTVALVGERC